MTIKVGLLKDIKIKVEDFEEPRFARKIVSHFFRKKGIAFSNDEKIKNIYLAKLMYRKFRDRTFVIEFPDGVDVNKAYKEFTNADFWIDKINFIAGNIHYGMNKEKYKRDVYEAIGLLIVIINNYFKKGLQWGDIDLNSKQIFVRRSLWKGQFQTPKSTLRDQIGGSPLSHLLDWENRYR